MRRAYEHRPKLLNKLWGTEKYRTPLIITRGDPVEREYPPLLNHSRRVLDDAYIALYTDGRLLTQIPVVSGES